MKKIILILALFSLGVSKAQVVGGYLPLNSTKSATMGGLRVNGTTITTSLGVNTTYTNSLTNFNLIHGTSTISMGSQSAGNPALWLGGGADATNYSLAKSGSNLMLNTGGANLYFQTGGGGNRGTWNSTGLRIGSGSNPTAVLDVTGDAKVSSTFSLGSANLTGGNTGTVAVLSDAVFCTQSSIKPYDPGDGLTIYFANSGYLGLTTSATYNRIYVPKNCTLIGYDITGYIDGSSGTAETSTISIRIDNTTDVTLNSSITYTTTYQQWHSMALSTDINSGSYFNLKWVTPTWVTNPTSVVNSVVLWFKLR